MDESYQSTSPSVCKNETMELYSNSDSILDEDVDMIPDTPLTHLPPKVWFKQITQPARRGKTFTCGICHLKFKRYEALQLHRSVHQPLIADYRSPSQAPRKRRAVCPDSPIPRKKHRDASSCTSHSPQTSQYGGGGIFNTLP